MRADDIDTSADHTWAQAVDHLLSHYVEPKITAPVFLTEYPVSSRRLPSVRRTNPG